VLAQTIANNAQVYELSLSSGSVPAESYKDRAESAEFLLRSVLEAMERLETADTQELVNDLFEIIADGYVLEDIFDGS
jgi:uncharacterized protein (DUF2267 family)